MDGLFSKIIYKLYGKKLIKEVNKYIASNFEIQNIIDLKYEEVTKIFANKNKIHFNVKYSFKDKLKFDLVGNIIKFNCYAHCECQIDDNIYNFKIKRKVSDEMQLRPEEDGSIEYTDDLIPMDRKYPMYGDVALIYRDYDKQKSSIDGVRVDVYKLANMIGITVYKNYCLDDDKQSAMICFFDTKLSLYNSDTNTIETKIFKKGSVILNKNYIDKRGNKSANFAVAHEIYHWIRHKYYVVLKHLDNGSVLYHSTFSRTNFFWKNNDERIEVQANKFAGTLLLQDRTLYNNFIAQIYNDNYLYDIKNRDYIIESALNRLSDIYQVSKKTLAITLSVVSRKGYTFDELNKYKNDFKQQYDHYDIYEKDFINLYLKNDDFYKLINERKLVYIKNKVVLNIKEAVIDGKITKYAKENPDKFFINFTITYNCTWEKLSSVLNNNSYKKTIDFDCVKNKDKIDKLLEQFEINEDAIKHSNESFAKQLYRYRKRLKITQESLYSVGINRQSISDYEKGKVKPKLDTLVKLIIEYHLTPNEINNLMIAGGYSFNNTKREKLIKYLIYYKDDVTIEEINECLETYGEAEIE